MDQTGTLQVRVVTSLAQLPLEGATVAITRRGEDGRHSLVSLQAADESGNARGVALAAPPVAESTAPGGEEPFFRVDVWAEHPGYEAVRIEGAQIFPDQDSVLLLALNPTVPGLGWTREGNVRPIPAQDL